MYNGACWLKLISYHIHLQLCVVRKDSLQEIKQPFSVYADIFFQFCLVICCTPTETTLISQKLLSTILMHYNDVWFFFMMKMLVLQSAFKDKTWIQTADWSDCAVNDYTVDESQQQTVSLLQISQ